MSELELKNYWDNKYPKNQIIYKSRYVPKKTDSDTTLINIDVDVKTMFAPNDEIIKNLIKNNNIGGETNDEKMWNIQKWVVQNIKYIGDNLNEGFVEYWQFPFETITFKNGDCEDGAILIGSMAINMGIPAFRIRVVAGLVQPQPTAPMGGHGYVAYLRESDNQWVAIDWCYLEDSRTPISEKPILKNNFPYKEIWFTFNNEYSWSHKELEFNSF